MKGKYTEYSRQPYSKLGKVIKKKLIDIDMSLGSFIEKLGTSSIQMNRIIHDNKSNYYYYVKYKDRWEEILGPLDIEFTLEEIQEEYYNYIKDDRR